MFTPLVLGALFGAVPLVGTYWAALPGALELCWSQGSPTLALLLFGAQLLPMSCVDTAIYADIKGYGVDIILYFHDTAFSTVALVVSPVW